MRATNHASGRGRKRSTTQNLACFAAFEARPIDAQMWPVHPVVWLQPELRPGLPGSSGLTIERHYQIPAPDFLRLHITPNGHARALDEVCDPRPPDLPRQLPRSDLAPLGWDPRTLGLSERGR